MKRPALSPVRLILAAAPLTPLVVWGAALGAWIATFSAVGLGVVLWRGRGCAAVTLGMLLLGLMLGAGTVETLVSIDAIGARARSGDLGTRDKVAVYGFNVAFGLSATAAGFGAFGTKTLALGNPWSRHGACPEDRLARYGDHLPRAYEGHQPRLRRWASSYPQRSPKIRAVVRRWAEELPAVASEGEQRPLGPEGPFTWPSRAYFSPDEANQVPIALNTPTTELSGVAVRQADHWRLDLTVDLAMAYPERASMHVGPFTLEEGMFHDARPLLQPYCAEVVWSVRSDDPDLARTEAIRGPQERLSTWLLRLLGARYG